MTTLQALRGRLNGGMNLPAGVQALVSLSLLPKHCQGLFTGQTKSVGVSTLGEGGAGLSREGLRLLLPSLGRRGWGSNEKEAPLFRYWCLGLCASFEFGALPSDWLILAANKRVKLCRLVRLTNPRETFVWAAHQWQSAASLGRGLGLALRRRL